MNIVGIIFGAGSMLLCAILFAGIGYYAGKRTEPMWFWSGSTVPSNTIRDIPKYNKANRNMWYLYSLPFWIGGIGYFINPLIMVITAIGGCTIGLLLIILVYNKIYKKYKV